VFLKTELSEKMVKEVLDNYVKKNINKFSENPAHNITMLEKSTINKIGNKIYYSARLGSGKQNIITISGGRPKNYTGD
jgi:proteasome assembly chaperone (PAC2) family protein